MSDIYNGGISLKIGDFTLKHVGSYEPKWTHEFDSGNSFENYNFEKITVYKGRRFSANVTTTPIPKAEADALMQVLYSHRFNFECPEFTGLVEIESGTKPYVSANRYGTYCTVSFSAAAVSLSGGSGSL